MIRNIITCILILLVCNCVKAQSVKSKIVNTAGRTFSNSTMIVTFNMGEFSTDKFVNTTTTIQSGFLHGDTTSIFQPVQSVAAAENIASENKKNIHVYPNPAASYVIVQLPSQKGKLSLNLDDVQGRTYWQQDVQNKTSVTIPLGSLSAGVYIIRIVSESGVQSVKLIKQ